MYDCTYVIHGKFDNFFVLSKLFVAKKSRQVPVLGRGEDPDPDPKRSSK
jgi:hypothetical protein